MTNNDDRSPERDAHSSSHVRANSADTFANLTHLTHLTHLPHLPKISNSPTTPTSSTSTRDPRPDVDEQPIDPDRAAQPIADWQPGDVIRLADGSIAAMMATDVLNPWVVLDTTDDGDAIFLDEDSPDLDGAVLLLRDGRPVTPPATRAEASS